MWIGGYETCYINCRGYVCIERCERLIALGELERVLRVLDDSFSVCTWSNRGTTITLTLSGARFERCVLRYTSETSPLESISW